MKWVRFAYFLYRAGDSLMNTNTSPVADFDCNIFANGHIYSLCWLSTRGVLFRNSSEGVGKLELGE